MEICPTARNFFARRSQFNAGILDVFQVCRELGISEHEFFTACDDHQAHAQERAAAVCKAAALGFRRLCLAGYLIAAPACLEMAHHPQGRARLIPVMARPPSSQRPPAKRQQASSRSIRQSVAAPRQRAALSRRTIQGRLVKQKARARAASTIRGA